MTNRFRIPIAVMAILFYPLTLWRCIRRPIRMMKYAQSELADDGKEQHDDALSPSVFLLITLFVAHLIELGLGVPAQANLTREGVGFGAGDDGCGRWPA